MVGCYLTEDAFLAKEGVFLLLDLLEVSRVRVYVSVRCVSVRAVRRDSLYR